MDLLTPPFPYYTLSGLAIGMLVGLTGVGGGALMTPLLILLFGIHPATAVGTDLLYASATKLAGTAFHGFKGTVDWRITARLAAGSLPATLATVAVLDRAALGGASYAAFLSPLLAACLVFTSVSLLLRRRIQAFAKARFGEPRARTVALLTVAAGVALGVLVSLTSVGAGALGVTALVLLYPTLPPIRVIASDIAHAVPLTLAAGVGHWYLGVIDWALLVSLLLGSLPGILLGSWAATHAPAPLLRGLLAVTLLAVAVKLVVG